MPGEWDAENVFDLLGNELVREILALTSREPLSAAAIAEECSASRPSVYRRLDTLSEYDMVAEATEYDADGNHYRTYESRLEEVCFGVDDGAFTVDIQLRRDPVA